MRRLQTVHRSVIGEGFERVFLNKGAHLSASATAIRLAAFRRLSFDRYQKSQS
jgi:hypothetical protein